MKMGLGEIRWEVDCIVLAQGRYKWNLRVPKNAGRLSSGYTTGSLSSSAQLHRVS
jgi:hypothetical protein